MAAFYNQATLSYSGGTVYSNIASGELLDVLAINKNAVTGEYTQGGVVTYVVNLINSGGAAITGLTLTDDLGAYEYGGQTLLPLQYIEGSLNYFVNGVLQAQPKAAAENPLTVDGISVPAGGNAAVVYSANVTGYASPAQGGSIVNTVTASGGGIADITASATVYAAGTPLLEMLKAISPAVVADNERLTYTFTVQNYGPAEAGADENIVLNDTFDPLLTELAVTCNGEPWTEDTNYSYDPATGVFTTTAGGITVPAASFTQDPDTGAWTVTPGTATVTVTGTV